MVRSLNVFVCSPPSHARSPLTGSGACRPRPRHRRRRRDRRLAERQRSHRTSSIPGTESQKAHRPARGEVPAGGGRVEPGRLHDGLGQAERSRAEGAGRRRRSQALQKLPDVSGVPRSARRGRRGLRGRPHGASRPCSTTASRSTWRPTTARRFEKAARAGEGDGVSVAGARRGRRPRGAAGRAGRRARRRRHRHRPADAPVPVARRDVRDARRRARRRRPEPDDPAGGEGADRDPGLRDHHRGDARPGCRHRLRAAHLQSLPRAAGRRRHRAGGGGARERDVRDLGGRRGPDRHGRDRRPARRRHPARSARWASDRPSPSPPWSSPRSPCCRSSPARWRSGSSRRTRRTSRAPSASRAGAVASCGAPPCRWPSAASRSSSWRSRSPSMRLGQPDDGNHAGGRHPALGLRRARRGRSARASTARCCSRSTTRTAARSTRRSSQPWRDDLAKAPGVAAVAPASLNEGGDAAILTVTPTTSPQDAATSDLVDRLRSDAIPAATRGQRPATSTSAGRPPGSRTSRTRSPARLPVFIAIVIGLSILLLMAVFRSIWVPLASAVFNLLSIGAAYGVIVAVFQWGWGASLLGVDERHADHLVRPAHDVRDPVRALDGLQRLPALPDPGGVLRGRQSERERRARPVADREGDPRRRPDHGLGVPRASSPAPT